MHAGVSQVHCTPWDPVTVGQVREGDAVREEMREGCVMSVAFNVKHEHLIRLVYHS